MKKLGILLMSLLFFSLIPSTSFANTVYPHGAGEWDYKGSDSVYADHAKTFDTNYSKVFYSGGGNLKICVSGFDLNTGNDVVRIKLINYDGPGTQFWDKTHDEKIGSNGVVCNVFSDINFWVDGDNNLAEFQFVVEGKSSSWNPEWVKIKVWD